MSGFGKTDSNMLPIAASNKDTNNLSGYAKTGFHFDLYLTYQLIPHLGIMLSVGGNMNSYDVTTLNTQYADQYTSHGGNGNLPAFTASGSYYIGQYLLGPCINIPAGTGGLSIEAKALFGLTTANYPGLSYSYSFFGTTISNTFSVKSASGFGYNVGAGLKYSLPGGLIGLHLGVAYGGSSISYPSYTSSYSDGTTTQTTTYNVPKAMSLAMLQITIGASVDL